MKRRKTIKVVIGYPPLESKKGVPLLGQNRQFQWFKNPSYLFPVVPAQAATLLKASGFEVFWLDGIAEKMTDDEWEKKLLEIKPDILAIETKTPVIKYHWRIIKNLKRLFTDSCSLKTVLMGDHVTALPQESMENCPVDFIITGGDYDFGLLNLVNHLNKGEKLEPGVWYRQGGKIKNTGRFQLNHDLNKLPFIDRNLTKWWLYRENIFKKKRATHTMAGRDCWWGKCTFCSWTTLYPQFRSKSPEYFLKEIEDLIKNYGMSEIMEDTGTFPCRKWLKDFCQGMIEKGLNRKMIIDCNMRAGVLRPEDFKLMKKAGFRILKFGLESGSQETLDRIKKGIKVKDIKNACRWASEAGLEVHLTSMIGYPWENAKDAQRTLDLAREMFAKGWADIIQATVVIPYPGTPLFEECRKNQWLLTEEWGDYDMTRPVIKTTIPDEKIMAYTRGLLKSVITPGFVFKKIGSIRSPSDLFYYFNLGKAVVGHLLDFNRGIGCL